MRVNQRIDARGHAITAATTTDDGDNEDVGLLFAWTYEDETDDEELV